MVFRLHLGLVLIIATAATAAAQEGAVATLTSDKEVYEYGERIVLVYKVVNEGEEEFTWTSGSTCAVGIAFDSLISPGESCGCFAAVTHHYFAPGASWTWTFTIYPPGAAVPETDGLQRVVAGKGILWREETVKSAEMPAEVTFEAPRYIGGELSLGLADGVTLDDVHDVIEALGATVLVMNWTSGYSRWRITGVTPTEAVAMYGDDERFRWMEIFRCAYPINETYQVGLEPGGERTEAGLSAPFPNPTSSSVRLEFLPPAEGEALIELLDLQGRRVALLHQGVLPADQPVTVTFDAPHLAAGMYVVRASGPGYAYSRPVTIVR